MSMENLKARWNAPTPAIFQTVIKIGMGMFVFFGGLEAILATLPMQLPAWIHATISGLSAYGIAMAKIGKLVVDNKQMSDEQYKKVFGEDKPAEVTATDTTKPAL